MGAALYSRNLIACTVGLALAVPGAMAQPAQPPAGEPNALSALLPHQKGRALCYVSSGAPVTYSLEDFPARKKPRTLTIRRFVFQLSSRKHDDDGSTNPPTPGKFYYAFGIMADVSARKRKLTAAGDCGSESMEGFGCGIDCDGGSVYFEPLAGTDSLMMRISDRSGRFRMTWGCGGAEEDGKSEVLSYDSATPAIRLDRAEPKACARVEKAFKRDQ